MIDGMDLALQKAIRDTLMGDSGLAEMVPTTRMFQSVSERPEPPYITFGETQESDDSVQCLDASEIFVDIHVWSTDITFAEVKRISALIKKLIHNQDLVLDEQRCVLIEHRVTRTFRDADTVTKHAVITFHALTEITDP